MGSFLKTQSTSVEDLWCNCISTGNSHLQAAEIQKVMYVYKDIKLPAVCEPYGMEIRLRNKKMRWQE